MSSVRQRPPVPAADIPILHNPAPQRRSAEPVAIRSGYARGAAGIGHGVRMTFLLLLTLALIAGIGVCSLAWRLGQGPLEVTAAVRWLAEHRLEQDVSVGRATIAWAGYAQGSGRAFHLELQDLTVTPPGQQPGTIQHASADLSMPALLRGQAVPRSLLLQGVRATIALDAAPSGPGPVSASDPGSDPATRLRALSGPVAAIVQELQSVTLEDADFVLTHAGIGPGHVQGDAHLTRAPAGGIEGAARAHISLGHAQADTELHASSGADGTKLEVTLTPVDLAALAVVPGLDRLAPLQAPLGLHATLDLSPALLPRTLTLETRAGPGRAVVQGVGLPFEALTLAGTASWAPGSPLPVQAEVSQGTLVIRSPSGAKPTTATFKVHAARTTSMLRAEGSVMADQAAIADFSTLWPERFGGHARPWLVENITAGTVHHGHAEFVIEAGADGTHPKLTALTAGMVGDDVTIHWLRPVPPVEHVQALLSMTTPDVLEITASSGRQGTARMKDALIRMTGLSVKDQDLSMSTALEGSVPELLGLLKHPRLHLLSDHPIPVQRPAGTLAGTLDITLPLEHDLQFEQVGIHGQGRLSGLRLGGIVAGRDLDRGTITFDVTQDGLHASGPATVAGFASDVTVEMNFTHGDPALVTQHATVAGRATRAQLVAGGFDPGAFMPAGAVSIQGGYTEHQSGRAEVALRADLREAVLAGAGWKKPSGLAGVASGRLQLLHGRLTGIDELRAEAPGLRIEGRAELAGGEPSGLVLNPIEIGPTRAHGEIKLSQGPGSPVRLNLAGPVLDLSSLFGPSSPGSSAAPAGKKPPAFVADLAFDTVLLAGQRPFGQVRAHAEHDGTRLNRLQVQTGGAERVQAEITPVPGGRRLLLRAQDAGAVFAAADVTSNITGGILAIDGRFDDGRPASPLSGTLNLTSFHVQDAPVVGKLLQALSVFGLPEALDGPGLKLNLLQAPFEWSNNDVYLGESEVHSASLGLTAKGHIDLGRHTLDVTGTVVPLYVINSALGRLPVIGRLFSPEKGGGLFSLSYGLHGPLADPAVKVNPLSILTPGLARRLFRLFD